MNFEMKNWKLFGLIFVMFILSSCGLISGSYKEPPETSPHANLHATNEPLLVRIDGETTTKKKGNQVFARIAPGKHTLELYKRVTDEAILGELRTKKGLELRARGFLTFEAKAGESYSTHMRVGLQKVLFWVTNSSGKEVEKIEVVPDFFENYYLNNSVF